MSTLGDVGAEFILKNAEKFKHLSVLNLTDGFITDEVGARLKAAIPGADVTGQREPDDWGDGELHRYASVGE